MASHAFEAIGYFHTGAQERYEVPRQAGIVDVEPGYVELKPQCNYEQALQDLDGFDRIWLIYCFHKNSNWKPKVLPPRGGVKRGVFATRAPHRPNPIGISCVELQRIDGLRLYVDTHDLLDGTPILDIKPYIVYADSFPQATQGWLEGVEDEQWEVVWNAPDSDIRPVVERRLKQGPYPYPSRRIRPIEGECYEMAYKQWRIVYSVQDADKLVLVTAWTMESDS